MEIKIDNCFNKFNKKDYKLKFEESSGMLEISYSERKKINSEQKNQSFSMEDVNEIYFLKKIVRRGESSFEVSNIFLGIKNHPPFQIMSLLETSANILKLLNKGEELAKQLELTFVFYKNHGFANKGNCFIREEGEIGKPFYEFLKKDRLMNNGEFTVNENIQVEEDGNGRININYLLPNYKSAIKYWDFLRIFSFTTFVILFFIAVFYFNPPGDGDLRAGKSGMNLIVIMGGTVFFAIAYFGILSKLFFKTMITIDRDNFCYSERFLFPVLTKKIKLSSIKYFKISTSFGGYEFLIYTDNEIFSFFTDSDKKIGKFLSDNLISSFSAIRL
jgi:hypothetical protein